MAAADAVMNAAGLPPADLLAYYRGALQRVEAEREDALRRIAATSASSSAALETATALARDRGDEVSFLAHRCMRAGACRFAR